MSWITVQVRPYIITALPTDKSMAIIYHVIPGISKMQPLKKEITQFLSGKFGVIESFQELGQCNPSI